MGYSLCKLADFQNFAISRIFAVFPSGFFAQNNSNVLPESFFARVWHFYFLTHTDHFAKSLGMGYSLSNMGDFQNRLISRISGAFSSGFLHTTTTNVLVE